LPTAVSRSPSSFRLLGQATSFRRMNALRSPSVAASSRNFCLLFLPLVTDASCPQQFSAVHRFQRCPVRLHNLGERTHKDLRLSPRCHSIFFLFFSLQVTDGGCPQQFTADHRFLPCPARPHDFAQQTYYGQPLSPCRHLIFPVFSPQVNHVYCPEQFSAVHRFLRCWSIPHHLGKQTHQNHRLSLRRHSIFFCFALLR